MRKEDELSTRMVANIECGTNVTKNILEHKASCGLEQVLANISPSDLESILLETYALKAKKFSIYDVLRQYESNIFVQPSVVDQKEEILFESFVVKMLPKEIKLVELSPVTALGTNSVLSNISQKTVLSTARNTEVVADGVSVLTLEIAKLRRLNRKDKSPIDLGTFQRELRTQKHVQPGFTPHFNALSIVSSNNTHFPEEFKSRVFSDHTAIYLRIIKNAQELGYQSRHLKVSLSNIRVAELLVKKLNLDRSNIMRHTQTPGYNLFDEYSIPLAKSATLRELIVLSESLPADFLFLRRPLEFMIRIFNKVVIDINNKYGDQVELVFDLSRHAGIGYYEDLCIKISAENSDGKIYPLADIGSNKWLANILNDKDERLITGGMGTELFLKEFRTR